MDFYLSTTPWWLRRLFPGCIWDIKTDRKTIYLTFDDGPHPDITPFVLDTLEQYNARASFFCIGDNVKKFPGIFSRVIEAGHTVGNHTMHHLNGWHTPDVAYMQDIEEAEKYIQSDLFRPPYGRIRRSQVKKLGQQNAARKIVMWSVLAGDWDSTSSPEKCFERVRKAMYPGSIVVFHDSVKAEERLRYVLPKTLEHFGRLGYEFKSL